METWNRICIEDHVVEAENGDRCEVKRGSEYLTTRERDGTVGVFTGGWWNVRMPAAIFAGERRFTEG
jgi:hypothetical protein